jgi:hypothetical protein
MRQQFVNSVNGMSCDIGKHTFQPVKWIDILEFAGTQTPRDLLQLNSVLNSLLFT